MALVVQAIVTLLLGVWARVLVRARRASGRAFVATIAALAGTAVLRILGERASRAAFDAAAVASADVRQRVLADGLQRASALVVSSWVGLALCAVALAVVTVRTRAVS